MIPGTSSPGQEAILSITSLVLAHVIPGTSSPGQERLRLRVRAAPAQQEPKKVKDAAQQDSKKVKDALDALDAEQGITSASIQSKMLLMLASQRCS